MMAMQMGGCYPYPQMMPTSMMAAQMGMQMGAAGPYGGAAPYYNAQQAAAMGAGYGAAAPNLGHASMAGYPQQQMMVYVNGMGQQMPMAGSQMGAQMGGAPQMGQQCWPVGPPTSPGAAPVLMGGMPPPMHLSPSHLATH